MQFPRLFNCLFEFDTSLKLLHDDNQNSSAYHACFAAGPYAVDKDIGS